MDDLKISIVVPTYNRREVLISQTLPAIFNQDIPLTDYEVVVVVDGSTDGTTKALGELRRPGMLRVLEQPNRGPAAARNNGIGAARGSLILFVDDDIICGPHLLAQHLAAHAVAEPLVAYGPIAVAPGTPPSILKYGVELWYQRYYSHLDSHGGLQWPQDDYLISNSSVDRATLIACGGFDEDMAAKEDYELGLRLSKMGMQFKYLPEAKAYEFYCKPSRYLLHNDGKGFGKTEVLLSRKHPEYRPHSPLAALGKVSGWRRLWRHLYMRMPVAPVGLLALPLWVCDKLCRFPFMQRAGHHLLGMGRGVVEFRSAAREAGSWEALQKEFGMRLPVLLYHRVGPARPGTAPGLTVSPESFERHVRGLAGRGYKGICPSDWVRWRREGKGLPDKPVLLTFDDGYADVAEYALPVLRRYGFGAVVYVVTGQLGGTNAWDQSRGYQTLSLMTADQIRYWATQGAEFGAHSRTHADLTSLSPHELAEEVVGSASDLESLLGSRVVSFAYPYGFHNPAVDECVRKTYDLAFLADEQQEGLNHLLTPPHLLLRTRVRSDDSARAVEWRARWGYNPFGNLRARIRLRSRLRRAVHRALGEQKVG